MNIPHQNPRHDATQKFIESLNQLEQQLIPASDREQTNYEHSAGDRQTSLDAIDQLSRPVSHSSIGSTALEDAVADIEQFIENIS
jgi:hypothetical protein